MTSLPAPGPEADRDLPLDAHLHTNLSPDSDVPIDAYCAAAVERGIPEIAITDHLDFDPRAQAHSFAPFATREREVRDAAARWADKGLHVRFGIEVSYESQREVEIREHLAHHPYDYAIGSVHIMADSPYTASRVAGWVAGRSFDEVVAPYFAEVEAAIRSELFDTIGHLDYVKKYVVNQVPPSAFAARPDVYEPLLRALVTRVRTMRPVSEVRIPASDGRLLAELHREGEVIDQRSEDSVLVLHVRATEALIGRLKRGGATVS